MKKIFLIVVLLLTTPQITFAQQAIAKIKFEEAEEAYAAKDYPTTIKKLDEVEGILKSTNPKVMYLRIMAQFPIITKNKTNISENIYNYKKLFTRYLTDYENLPDNDDKYRDIYKISEKIVSVFKETDMEFLEKIGFDYKIKDDYENAIKYYKDALSLGSIEANYFFRYIYYYGLGGVSKDYKIAFKYFKVSADNDCRDSSLSQLIVGGCYNRGQGVDKNYNQALKYLLLTKYSDALYEIASIYYFGGYGVEKDLTQCLKYNKLSADQGSPVGEYQLGFLFLNGEGVNKNENEAKIWFQKSADQGNEDAKKELEKLKS